MVKGELLRARRALSDSINATFAMTRSDYAVDWRFNYIVAITTVRAVGHILHRVDCNRFPEIADEVRSRFERWKLGEGDDDIFRYFIEDARNVLIKTYSFTNSDAVVFNEGEISPDGPDIDLVMHGYFEGADVVGLLQASHRWGLSELDAIAQLIEQPVSDQ